jgi:hypothetical protein
LKKLFRVSFPILFFNVGHTMSLTVLELEMDVLKFLMRQIKRITTVSLVEEGGSLNEWVTCHPAALSSELLSMNWSI